MHRKISKILLLHKRLFIHTWAAITYKNYAYIFCAPSGTGKTTHISLWKKFLGKDVGIINGDKPFLSFENENGQNRITVCGSPWAGKKLWQKNRSAQSALSHAAEITALYACLPKNVCLCSCVRYTFREAPKQHAAHLNLPTIFCAQCLSFS